MRRRAPNAQNDVPFTCGWEGCSLRMEDRKAWKAHMADEHGVDATRAPDGRRCKHTACQGQAGPYGDMAALVKHNTRKHQSPNKHACQVLGCEASYDNADSLRRHVQAKHSGKAPAPRKGTKKASAANKENEEPVAGPSGHRHSSAEESSDDEDGEGADDEDEDESDEGPSPHDVKDKGKGRAYDYDDYDDDGELEYV